MSYGEAIQRMGELRQMTAASMLPAAAPAAAPPALAAQFQQQLAASVLAPEGDAAGTEALAAPASTAATTNPYAALQAGGLSTQAALLQQLGLGGTAGIGATGAVAQPVAPVATQFVTGKTANLDPQLLQRLDALGRELGTPIDVISGNRTYAEQAALYEAYRNGTGNLAAPPGSSNHEHGAAVDAYVNGTALGNVPGAREAAARLGLGFPVGGEAWHVERTDA